MIPISNVIRPPPGAIRTVFFNLFFRCNTSKITYCNLCQSMVIYNCSKGTERKETNMEKTYIRISITYHSTHFPPETYYYLNDGVHVPTIIMDKLTVDQTNRLMWELIRIGGKNNYRSNIFNNAISTREVTFYGFL